MTVRIILGDVRERLKSMTTESVQTVVTSPPYFGLRDYGTASWEGGDENCSHSVGSRCHLCGARRIDKQIGLERTPHDFVETMVQVFRLVRRVLRPDGTLWLNLGDSYATGAGKVGEQGAAWQGPTSQANRMPLPGIKPGNLIGIPWRVAFALQADGWVLRQDIIWSKPNPMPESITDRCTKAHEYLFLFAKSGKPTIWRARDTGEWSSRPNLAERLTAPTDDDPGATTARWRGFDYYFDQDAIAEPCESGESDLRKMAEGLPRIGGKHKDLVDPLSKASSATNIGQKRSVGGRNRSGMGSQHKQTALGQNAGPTSTLGANYGPPERNRRSVWLVGTQSFSEAHFATFPPKLIEPCILAGCPRGGVVLDPFGGAGTTGLVADRLGRDAILIELNPKYADMARRRIQGDGGMFSSVDVVSE